MATRNNESHNTDRLALAVLAEATSNWSSMKPEQDYGIDAIYELFEDSDEKYPPSSGIDFGVQLKGVRNPEYGKDYIKTPSIKKELLKYFATKRRRPTFIVVVDVTQKCGYWLDVGSVANEKTIESWETKGTASFRVPLTNKISLTDEWRNAIINADLQSRKLWSVDPLKALSFAKEEFEDLNPGSTVNVSVDEKGVNYSINYEADKKFMVKLIGKKGSVEELLEKVAAEGDFVDISSFDVSIDPIGFPVLPGQSGKESITSIKMSNAYKCTCRLKVVSDDGVELSFIDLDGELKGGLKRSKFSSCIGDRLLSADIELNDGQLDFTIGVSTESWKDKDVRYLDNFDKLWRFLKPLGSNCSLQCELVLTGSPVVSWLMPANGLDKFVDARGLIEMLDRLGAICRSHKISVKVPDDDTSVISEYDICILEEILSCKSVNATANDFSFDVMPSSELLSALSGSSGIVVGVKAEFPKEKYMYKIFGQQIDVGPVMLSVPPVDVNCSIVERDGGVHVAHCFTDKQIPIAIKKIHKDQVSKSPDSLSSSHLGIQT